MRTLFVLLLIPGLGLLLLAGRGQGSDAEREKEKVRSVLKRYVSALEAEDVLQLSQLFVEDEDLVTVNAVGPPGIARGPAKLKAAAQGWFDAVENIDVTVRNEVIKVHPAGHAAWVSFTLDGSHSFPDRESGYEYTGMRATWGLEKRKGDYRIVQGHWSFVSKDR